MALATAVSPRVVEAGRWAVNDILRNPSNVLLAMVSSRGKPLLEEETRARMVGEAVAHYSTSLQNDLLPRGDQLKDLDLVRGYFAGFFSGAMTSLLLKPPFSDPFAVGQAIGYGFRDVYANDFTNCSYGGARGYRPAFYDARSLFDVVDSLPLSHSQKLRTIEGFFNTVEHQRIDGNFLNDIPNHLRLSAISGALTQVGRIIEKALKFMGFGRGPWEAWRQMQKKENPIYIAIRWVEETIKDIEDYSPHFHNTYGTWTEEYSNAVKAAHNDNEEWITKYCRVEAAALPEYRFGNDPACAAYIAGVIKEAPLYLRMYSDEFSGQFDASLMGMMFRRIFSSEYFNRQTWRQNYFALALAFLLADGQLGLVRQPSIRDLGYLSVDDIDLRATPSIEQFFISKSYAPTLKSAMRSFALFPDTAINNIRIEHRIW